MILTATDMTNLIRRLGGSSILSADDQAMIADDLVPRAQAAVKRHIGYGIETGTYTEYLPSIDTRVSESPLDQGQWNTLGQGSMSLASEPISELFLREKPVRSITSVYENPNAFTTDPTNGDFSADFLLTPGESYQVDWDEPGSSFSGILRRAGFWPLVPRCVKIVYVAGLSVDDLATEKYQGIREAVMITAQLWYMDVRSFRVKGGQGGSGMVKSESLGDWSASYDLGKIADDMGLSATLPQRAKSILREFLSMTKYFGR